MRRVVRQALLEGDAPLLVNYNPAQLSRFKTARDAVKAGTGSAKILCLGDSTTLGYGSNGAGGTGDMKTAGYPAVLASLLNTAGINAQANSYLGGGTSGANQTSVYDPRITIGSSWAPIAVISLGGDMYFASTTTNALSFLPTSNVDTFDIYYYQTSSLGTFSWNVNGGADTNINAGTLPQKIAKATVSAGSLGSNTLNIKYVSGTGIYIVGVDAYDSSKKWVSVLNAGWIGSKSTSWSPASNQYDPSKAITWLAPDLTIICLGINDWNTNLNVPVPTFISNMQTIITNALSVGDVLLMSPCPSRVAGVAPSLGDQRQYVTETKNLAYKNNVPLIDIFSQIKSYEAGSARGLYHVPPVTPDGYHLSAAGYAYEAGILNNFLIGI